MLSVQFQVAKIWTNDSGFPDTKALVINCRGTYEKVGGIGRGSHELRRAVCIRDRE